jgi:hypothetical protein
MSRVGLLNFGVDLKGPYLELFLIRHDYSIRTTKEFRIFLLLNEKKL